MAWLIQEDAGIFPAGQEKEICGRRVTERKVISGELPWFLSLNHS